MRDALPAFAAYCDRHSLEERPTVWAAYTDIWNEPKGEIGHADTLNNDLATTCFALLAPWVMVPTIGEAWLIVDHIDSLKVTRLRATGAGMFDPHWSVPYAMTDDGRLVWTEDWEPETPIEPIAKAISGAKQARSQQMFWQMDHTLETIIPVVAELLR